MKAIMTAKKEVVSPIVDTALFQDVETIVSQAQRHAYQSINIDLVKRNWLIGKRIAEEELDGAERAEYGKAVIKNISKQLTDKFGKGFSQKDLYQMVRLYSWVPNLFDTQGDIPLLQILRSVTIKSSSNILDSLTTKSQHILLTWTHYTKLLQVEDYDMRLWYAQECAREAWSVRTLQRNISSQYCSRLLASQVGRRELVHEEMQRLTSPLQNDPKEYIKNPVVMEFLGLSENPDFQESTLETAIISNLQKFLLEMGKGWAFMGRQQRIHTEKQDYYIDLVFYNVLLKCYILIDLKTEKVSYQDVGQMDMYIKMYDEKKRTDGDGPTLGIILCADTDEDIARYAINGNQQLFASKYLTVLPSEEQLRNEIERQKQFFLEQHPEYKEDKK